LVTYLDILGIVNTLSMFAAATALFWLAINTKTQLRILSILLGGFAFFHGAYHLSFLLSQSSVAIELVEPVAIVFLMMFAGYYWKKGLP